MKDKKTIYIRVDANEQIAMGHLMRTMSIAEAVRAEGGECCFITSDHHCDEKLESKGFPVICLDSVWDDLNQEIRTMEDLIKSRNIGCLLLDSYFVTPEYFGVLSKLTKIIYIDDLKAFPYECQAIINYVIGESHKDYSYFQGELYTGAQYVPLRKEFSEGGTCLSATELKRIMVTTGGADMYHFGVHFLKTFLEDDRFKTCHVTLVVGSKNQDKDHILEAYGQNERVTVMVDAENMSQLMIAADAIVSAGGTTLYEACACKTPSISYALADNQLTNVMRFDELGGLYYAGDIRHGIHAVIGRILDKLEIMKSAEVRQQIAETMGNVVDGQGATRIARILIEKVK